MRQAIRLFPFFEGAAFLAAALTHFGVLIHGYEHQKAGTAESVIGIVLLIGFALSWIRPRSTRSIGIGVQAFALFGTLVGIFTIAVGVGPRTAPDIVYHVVIVTVLVSGLVMALRARFDKSRQRA
jgi:phosphatidylserine synthase